MEPFVGGAPPRPPERVGALLVCAPLPAEIESFRKAIRFRKTLHLVEVSAEVGLVEAGGRAPARTAVAAAIGVGRAKLERSLERLCAEFRPSALLLVGTAGGCRPGLRPGSLVLCDPFVVEPDRGPNGVPIEGRAPLRPEPRLANAIRRAAMHARVPLTEGTSVTVNVAALPAAKASLGRNRGATVCDMEDYFFSRFAVSRGLPFAALRAVFDPVDERLPDFAGLGERSVLRLAIRRPRLLLALPRLALRMLKVRRVLDPVARTLLGELASAGPE